MSEDITTFYEEPMALPMEVRFINKAAREELAGYPQGKLLQYLLFAKRRIKAVLRERYGADDSGLQTSSPNVSAPIPAPLYEDQIENFDSFKEGTDNYLIAVKVNDGVSTDQWLVEFTTATAFSVTGLFTGANGTGSTSSDFTSTDTYIEIPTNAWFGSTFKKGDKFYFTTNNFHQYITFIAALLAAGYAIGGEYTPAGHETKILNPHVRYAEELLKELADVNSGVGLESVSFSIDSDPVAMPYDVDDLGRVLTDAPTKDEYGNYGEMYWQHVYHYTRW